MRGDLWSKDRDELLRKLWATGASARMIAAQIGGLTRNAIIGRAHRIGLAGRRPGSLTKQMASLRAVERRKQRAAELQAKTAKKAPATTGQKAIVRDLFRAATFVPAPLPTGSDLVPLVSATADLEPHHCRWIPGEPSSGYCGRPRVLGLSYCEHHAKRAFQAPKTPEVPGRNPAGTTAEPAELEAA